MKTCYGFRVPQKRVFAYGKDWPSGLRKSRSMSALKNLLLDQLAEMYEAEPETAKTLTWMAGLARDQELRDMLKLHACEASERAAMVAEIFRSFGEDPVASKGSAIRGLMAEADALVAQHKGSPARDAAIISAAQKLEHYEIATFQSLREWAAVLNNRKACILLEEMLDEEKASDRRLSYLSHRKNVETIGPPA